MGKWPWNLVPTLIGMPNSGVSLGAAGHAKDGVFGHYSFFIVREWFASKDQVTRLGPAVCVGSDWGFG